MDTKICEAGKEIAKLPNRFTLDRLHNFRKDSMASRGSILLSFARMEVEVEGVTSNPGLKKVIQDGRPHIERFSKQ